MKTNMIKEFNNEELLKEICDVYGYDVKYNEGYVLCTADEEDEEYPYTYKNIELALIGWLDTLIESEMEYRMDNVDITWISEINYIKDVKSELLFNKDSKTLKEAIVYGEIPKHMYKNLSVFLDERIKRVEQFVQITNDRKLNTKALNVVLPVEFIMQNNKLEYLKIANKNFLERLIFEGDTSEVEFYEYDLYDKNGKIDMIPLMPMDNTSKFELSIPVAITIVNNYLRIQTPINYLYLF